MRCISSLFAFSLSTNMHVYARACVRAHVYVYEFHSMWKRDNKRDMSENKCLERFLALFVSIYVCACLYMCMVV